MSRLRRAVMDSMDDYYETTDGSTPDHIIVSRAVWRDMKTRSRFEKLGSTDIPKRRRESYGFMGMRVWQSAAVGRRNEDFLLVSEDVFERVMPTVRDWRLAE